MQLERVLRAIITGGIFLLPFVPFVVLESLFFPFVGGKALVFRVVTELMVGSWIILALRNPAYRLRRSALLLALTAFIVVIFIADIFGANFQRSFWSNFERMEGFVTLLHLFGYILVAGAFLKTERLWERLFQTSVAASIVMGFYALLQILGFFVINQGGVRVDGTFGNASYLAVYMLFHVFITLLLVVRHKGPRFVYWLYSGALLLQLFTLWNTGTRGALIGLAGGLALTALIVALFDRARPRLRKAAGALVLLVILLAGSVFLLRDSSIAEKNLTLQRLTSISLDDDTTLARFIIWGDIAWKGFLDRPVLGWGQENFNLVFDTYYNPRLFNQEPWFDRAHNAVFDWLIAGGVLGLLAYLSIFGAVLLVLWRKSNLSITERALITGLFAGYFVHNFFVFDNVVSYWLFGTILAFVYAMSGSGEKRASSHHQVAPVLQQIALPVVGVLAIIAVYFFNIPGLLASNALLQAIRPQPEGPAKNLELFDRALSYNTYGTPEIRERLLHYSRSLQGTNTDENARIELFSRSIKELEEQIEETPDNVRYELFYGAFLTRFGLHREGVEHLQRARELSPGKQQILFEIGLSYVEQERFEEALLVFEEAFEFAPAYNQAKDLYAAVALRAGEFELGNRLTSELVGNAYDKNGVPIWEPSAFLINSHIASNRIETATELWKVRVDGKPDDTQTRISYAAGLLELGRREEAIAQIEEAIMRDASFKGQGEEFIRAIREGRI